MEERLQKVMAEFGVASRRKCEELILQGFVKVNGSPVTELGTKVDREKDAIEVNGKLLKPVNKKIYILLNKPEGYITSSKDQFGRATVLDLVKNAGERVFPVGRLDYDTEGLLILTNDGDLTYRVTHPKHNINKTYTAFVRGIVKDEDIKRFREGIVIDNYKTAPARLEILKHINGNSLVNITIHEGRNRQVRKMCDAINHGVLKLKRIRIGKIDLGDLGTGEWRYLSEAEVKYLYDSGGVRDDSGKKDKA